MAVVTGSSRVFVRFFRLFRSNASPFSLGSCATPTHVSSAFVRRKSTSERVENSFSKGYVQKAPKTPLPAYTFHELEDWTVETKRTGLLGVKLGMVPVWNEYGDVFGCSVLAIEDCQVSDVKTIESHGYNALQLAAGIRKCKNIKKPALGHLARAGITEGKRTVQEFRITSDAVLPLGYQLTARHFVAGQYVDLCGISKGKGFQGVMKRWGFKGQGASHGVSKAHRHAGSTGQCQDPGKVFKGKKMAGHMGHERVTIDNCLILKIDVSRNLIYVKGPTPGPTGSIVRITDARKKIFDMIRKKDPLLPPLPTCLPWKDSDDIPKELLAPKPEIDPFYMDPKAK